MSLFTIKMRASKHTGQGEEHISGAENILPEEAVSGHLPILAQRALHHGKGKADFINMKIESLKPEDILYMKALRVSTISVDTPEAGRAAIRDMLEKLGFHNDIDEIFSQFSHTYGMRGAMLWDLRRHKRLEPDQERGVRATYMDESYRPGLSKSGAKNHFREALVLATKVANTPHIVGEICMSDDPDYVTGYIATKDIGYVRITTMKKMGDPNGGRIFLYDGPEEEVQNTIHFLEEQPVIVTDMPSDAVIHKVEKADKWKWMHDSLSDLREKNLHRTIVPIDTPQADRVSCGGGEKILLASNHYLGLSSHPYVKKRALEALTAFGTGSGGSRLTTGTLPLHEELEEALARFKGTEAALLFNTGYMANVGTISALGRKGTVIFSDELNHASIIDGCRLSHAKTVIFKHNDMKDLEEKIRAYVPMEGLIITEGVFSMQGDIAPVPEIVALGKKYHLLTMVDEAHSTGVLGETGKGAVEYFHMKEKPDILMGTLSKALASEGGYVCGPAALIDYLRNTARSFIFSTSQTPANLGAALGALELLENDPSCVEKLHENTRFFCRALEKYGLPAHTESAIVPIPVGDEGQAEEVQKKLFDRGIFISAIRYPTVPKGKALLRAAVMATHRKEDLDYAARTIAEVLKETGPAASRNEAE